MHFISNQHSSLQFGIVNNLSFNFNLASIKNLETFPVQYHQNYKIWSCIGLPFFFLQGSMENPHNWIEINKN